MEDNQKQPDTPGIGGEQFQIKLDNTGFANPHQFFAALVESMYGTEHIIDSMVRHYQSQQSDTL